MDECGYSPENKQIFLKFDRTMIAVDVEEFMDILYALEDLKQIVQQDPEVTLGEFTDEEGNTWEQFVVKSEDEEYS